MPRRLGLMLTFAALLLVAGDAVAHHSVTGQFDPTKPVTLSGQIVKVDWINPHVYLFLEVKEPDGSTKTWTLETAPTAMLRRAGLTKESIKGAPGEVVTVTGIVAREAASLAFLYKITYADGRFVQLSADRR